MILSRLGLAAIALLVSLPFLIPEHTNPIPSFHEEWIAATLGLVATIALVDARQLPLPGAALLALALAAIALAQEAAGFAPVPQLASLFGLYLFWAALLACTSRHLVETFGHTRFAQVLATALLSGAILAAMASLLQPWLANAGWTGFPPRRGGPLGQANHLTSYLWLGLASALYLRHIDKLRNRAFWTIAILLTLTVVLIGQRSSFMFAAGLIGIAVWQGRGIAADPFAKGRRRALGIGLLFILLQPLPTMLPPIYEGGTHPSPAMRAIQLGSGPSQRLQLVRAGLEGIRAEPLLGNGIGSYSTLALTHSEKIPPDSNPGPSEHAHNLLVDLGAELGLPAALLVLLGSVIWLRNMLRRGASAEAGWAATVLIILCLHSMIEYPLWYSYFLGLLAVVTGAVGQPRAIGKGLAPVALVIGVLIWGTLTLLQVRRDYAQLELAHAMGGRPSAIAQASEALQHIPATSLLAPWVAATVCVSLDPLRVPVADGQSVCLIALSFAPTIECVVNAAVIQWRAGDGAGARELLQKLRRATRQFGAEKLDSLTASLIARDPRLKTLLTGEE